MCPTKMILLVVACIIAKASAFDDLSDSPWIFSADKLPTDEKGNFLPRYMATVGNGHIGWTVFTNFLFMNGLYNGNRGESHRASIPSRNNVRVKPAAGSDARNWTFSLDVKNGWFEETFNTNGYLVTHRIFAHRLYHTAIINQITVRPSEGQTTGDLTLELEQTTNKTTDDFVFEEESKFESVQDATIACGRTKDVEDPQYQPEQSQICIVSLDIPKTITVNGPTTITYFTVYAKSLLDASTDFNAIAELISNSEDAVIASTHAERWNRIWSNGRIQVKGNTFVQKILNGCFYYLLSSLPISSHTNSPIGEFFGLSPGGLANGWYITDFQGHNFWDTEIWIFPVLLYFYPETALHMLNYRMFRVQAARDNAEATGFKGARFPWESGFTGREVTPECCPLNAQFQVHITGDVAFAIRQYISATRDLEWLTEVLPGYSTHGLGLLKEIAEFWISRITFDQESRQHEILHVMPPDDDHRDVDNSVFTNVVAAYSIFFARYAQCLAEKAGKADDKFKIPDDWLKIAESLKLAYNSELKYHPEYDGYPAGELIKQADTVLLGFPLMYPMSPEVRKNDLLLYGNVTRPNGPGMTWAMHLIGFLDVDDQETADQMFLKTFEPYVREPFKVWTEIPPPTLGAVNYLTGQGSFLQGVVSGYGGLRMYAENITFVKPRLIKNTESLELYGLSYLGNTFNLVITAEAITLELVQVANKYPLVIVFPNGTTLDFKAQVQLPAYPSTERFAIKGMSTKCPLPEGNIDRSYQGQAAQTNHYCIKALIILPLVAQWLIYFYWPSSIGLGV